MNGILIWNTSSSEPGCLRLPKPLARIALPSSPLGSTQIVTRFLDISNYALPANLTSADTRSIAVADVDGDGDLDVLLGNANSSCRVLLNAGDGTFPTSIELPYVVGEITHSIAAADMDGDGDLDVLLGNDNSPSRLLLKAGNR